MDMLIDGRAFEYRNNDTYARLNFRNGNFVLICQCSSSGLPETIHGIYFFAKDDVFESPVLVLRRTKADRLINSRSDDPLTLAHQMLSLNTLLKIEFVQKQFELDSTELHYSLILRGFHVFSLR